MPAKPTQRDLLFALAYFTRNLVKQLAITDVVPPKDLRAIIDITTAQLDQQKIARGSDVLQQLLQDVQGGRVDAAQKRRTAKRQARKGSGP